MNIQKIYKFTSQVETLLLFGKQKTKGKYNWLFKLDQNYVKMQSMSKLIS